MSVIIVPRGCIKDSYATYAALFVSPIRDAPVTIVIGHSRVHAGLPEFPGSTELHAFSNPCRSSSIRSAAGSSAV
jgi:hypothetical protein